MKNIHLKIEDDLHLRARQYQIAKELAGQKQSLMEIFVELIENGLRDTQRTESKKS